MLEVEVSFLRARAPEISGRGMADMRRGVGRQGSSVVSIRQWPGRSRSPSSSPFPCHAKRIRFDRIPAQPREESSPFPISCLVPGVEVVAFAYDFFFREIAYDLLILPGIVFLEGYFLDLPPN